MKYILFVLLTGLTAYGAIEGYGLYKDQQQVSQLKADRADINKINYGLFNLDLWKKKVMAIFDDKIGEFKISPDVYKQLEDEVMIYLDNVYEEYIGSGKLVNEMIAEAEESGSVNKFFLKMIKGNIGDQIKKLKIDRQLPNIAKAISKEIKANEPKIRYYIEEGIQDMLFAGAEDVEIIDPRTAIYNLYGALDLEGANIAILSQIEAIDPIIDKTLERIIIILGISILLGILLYKILGFQLFVSHWTIISVVLLVLGVSMPMIDLDARLNSFQMDLMGNKVGFDEQSLYYQSKSIIDVTSTLIKEGAADLKIVGYMILMFSVIFPFIKLLLSALFLFSSKVSKSKLAKGIIFHLGKWSMADVFVVALFMAYIGFHGLLTSQLGGIARNETGFNIETLNYSRLAPGALFFTSYCILSIIIGIIINRHEQKSGFSETV
ncbi:MAG: hypothetical protein HN488_11405 [Saprospiraceae bacterium]|nr:hypothetical protein [Saprospiraceae bacterium]